MILYLRGTFAKELYSGVRSKLSGPPGQVRVKCCRSVTTKRNISMRARDSPTQARFPESRSTESVSDWDTTEPNLRGELTYELQRCIPAENGRKAGFFLKLPFSSRKCCGLKEPGVSHTFSSFSTECNKGMMIVPCRDKKPGHVGHFQTRREIWNVSLRGRDTLGIV